MNAHWLNDGERVLVTGTDDPEQARAYLAEYEPDMLKFASEDPGYPHRGNIIPQHPESDYRWIWYSSDKGRVKAVTFK